MGGSQDVSILGLLPSDRSSKVNRGADSHTETANTAVFSKHWHRHHAERVNDAKLNEADAFLQPAWDFFARAARPLRILDVGCGDGVHAAAMARHGLGPHSYIGVDRAFEAIRLARARASGAAGERITFHTGDATALPLRDASVDVVLCYGVLAYTGNPEKALDELVRVCRPGALVGIWVAPARKGLASLMLKAARAVCRLTGRPGSFLLVNAIVPLLFVLPVRSGVNLATASWAECVEVVEVNLLPDIDYYTVEQVRGWFEARAVRIEFVDEDRPVAMWGRTAAKDPKHDSRIA
jgi:SAM-dependent methyltransferase